MNIIHHITQIDESRPTAVALGTFDGLHIGHQAVIRAAVSEHNVLRSAVLTFQENPHGGPLIVTRREKEERLFSTRPGPDRRFVLFHRLEDQ